MTGAATSLGAAPLLVVLLLPLVASASGSFEVPAPTVSIDPNAFVPDQKEGDAFAPHDHPPAGERLAAGSPNAEGISENSPEHSAVLHAAGTRNHEMGKARKTAD